MCWPVGERHPRCKCVTVLGQVRGEGDERVCLPQGAVPPGHAGSAPPLDLGLVLRDVEVHVQPRIGSIPPQRLIPEGLDGAEPMVDGRPFREDMLGHPSNLAIERPPSNAEAAGQVPQRHRQSPYNRGCLGERHENRPQRLRVHEQRDPRPPEERSRTSHPAMPLRTRKRAVRRARGRC